MHILLCGLESSRKNLALDTTMYQIKASFKMMANAQKNSTEEFEVFADAAHAVTPALGQGANLAFEDGLELAIQLSSASDLSSALRTYEERRIPRAQIVSARTRATGVAHPQSFYDWLYNEIPSSSLNPDLHT
jgi:2-polyprenyl-6-methoxyphenol hydroxylase-like FAD-dependent oxidoreductase